MVRMKTIKRFEFPPPLLESQVVALSTLANEGPTSIYYVQKKTGRSYSLMFNAIKELEKRGLVKLIGKKQTVKGTTANIYDLTLKGVLSILRGELASADTEEWNYNRIREIIVKYASLLPLVFGKWDYFDRIDVGKMALCRLQAVVVDLDAFEPGRSWIPGESLEKKVCWFFYFTGFLTFPQSPGAFEGWCGMENPEKWMDAWVQDEDIKAFVVKEIEDYQTRLRDFGAFVESHITVVIGNRRNTKGLGVRGRSWGYYVSLMKDRRKREGQPANQINGFL